MKAKISHLHFFLIIAAFSSVSLLASSIDAKNDDGFLKCISTKFENTRNYNASEVIIFIPDETTSYLSVLYFSAQNLRFTNPQTHQPLAILTPTQESHIQDAIFCSKKHDIQIRIRSGGHDFEGVSYVSQLPFIIIDMVNLRSVEINTQDSTAWVQSGATLGEIYYNIAKKSKTLAFPAGICPSVGAGGHISGGGYGMLVRKYGLASDHVIDARLIDVNGRVLDRKSMGEDLFWAIRGGGGASFGVIVAWKLGLVDVPNIVTVFTVAKTLEQNATELVHEWQSICSKIDKDLSWKILLTNTNTSQDGKKGTVLATFSGLYLGGIDKFLPLMLKSFPQLRLSPSDCQEMSWIESIMYFSISTVTNGINIPYKNYDELLNRTNPLKFDLKIKSEFVKQVIPQKALEGIWKRFLEEQVNVPGMSFTALGGRMSEISSSEIPFPHRDGNLYLMEYNALWFGGGGGGDKAAAVAKKYMKWIRRLYRYLTPYVSKSPRQAYLNYRALDLGVNNVHGNTSYEKAKRWGVPYYVGNFKRLASVKTLVDPSNFFRFEQSIPLLSE